MLPELEKIIVADRKARAAVDQARQEAEALLSEIRAKLDSLKTDLDQQIEHLKKTTAEEISRQAEARAADITEGTHRYVDKLTGQAQSREEEALSFLVSQVLAG
jgi:vacuolar-type H+-ATPase subunit H